MVCPSSPLTSERPLVSLEPVRTDHDYIHSSLTPPAIYRGCTPPHSQISPSRSRPSPCSSSLTHQRWFCSTLFALSAISRVSGFVEPAALYPSSPPVTGTFTLLSEGLVLAGGYDIETARLRLRPSLVEFAETRSPRAHAIVDPDSKMR